MLHSEALALEMNIEQKIKDCLNLDAVEISLTLGNKICARINNMGKYLFNRDTFELVSFRFENFIDCSDFDFYRKQFSKFFKDNEQDIKQLLWSYDNRANLKVDDQNI